MFRLGSGFILFGLVAATQAAQFDEAFFEPELNLLATVNSDSMLPYKFSASVVLTQDAVPIEPESGIQFSSAAKPQQDIVRTMRWKQTYDGDHFSLSRLLRIEFKREQVNITFLPRSISIEGKQLKVTFRAQSALIEKERLKLLLQPHSATMLWNKAF